MVKNKKKKIVFLLSSQKMADLIKKNLEKLEDEVAVELASLNDSLEVAKKLISEGTEIIITKTAVKMKIYDEISIPILSIENNIIDYIEILEKIDLTKEKVLLLDYLEPTKSMHSLSKMFKKNLIFKTFRSEEECKKMVEDCRSENIKHIIGGAIVAKYASQNIENYYEATISKESLEYYIDLAWQIVEMNEKKNLKEKVMKNIEKMIDNYLNEEVKLEKNILDKVNLNEVEKNKIIDALKENSFSLTKTAKALGISRTTLWRKLKKFDISIQ